VDELEDDGGDLCEKDEDEELEQYELNQGSTSLRNRYANPASHSRVHYRVLAYESYHSNARDMGHAKDRQAENRIKYVFRTILEW
jgi:hypothetical protein